MKRKFIVIISILFIMPFILIVKSMAAESNCTQEQKAIQEVADAYYQRGINAQYNSRRATFTKSPEEATSQHTIYTDCTDFTYLVYKKAFDIDIQGGYSSPERNIAYAIRYYDSDDIVTNDVIEYWEKTIDENKNVIYKDNKGNVKDIDLSTPGGRQNYAKYLLEDCHLQVGDILCYHYGGYGGKNSGHAMLVYEIIYDENNNPIDAITRESTSNKEYKTTKLTGGLSYNDNSNTDTNVNEGTFRQRSLANENYNTYSSITETLADNRRYFTIIRPLLKDNNGNYTGKYYFSTYEKNENAPTRFYCTNREEREYEITPITEQRLKYNSIYIEKTVDVFNGSVVNLGDTLEYSIKIKNNSATKYNSFEIIENIPQYVEIINNGNGTIEKNEIKWNIPELRSKQSIEIKYKVKVKNNTSYLGKEIVSTGTVADIPSSTVKNTISCNLNNDEKLTINQKIQSLINSKVYHGQELISKIYEQSFGIDLELDKFDITDLVKTTDSADYYPPEHTKPTSIYLNPNNKFSNMLLNNYYGALYTDNDGVKLKSWENASSAIKGRSERADNIYKENFQTGDVLVYKNTQTTNENVKYKTEDGTYYLIYIDEEDKITVNGNEMYGFIGLDENGKIINLYRDESDYKDSSDYSINDLRTLLGKDYYVVLRPSMALDIVPMNLGVSYSTTKFTNGGVKATITSNEEMLPVSGWTLSSNKKRLTKTFTKNIDKEYPIYDLGGNKVTVRIKIDNIVEKLGDINKDSKINIADLIGVIRHIGSKEGSKYYLNEEKRFIADINQDGKINIADVIGIIRLISRSK